VAPFLQPDLVWDFRLPRVKSINVSGHKYGLVFPGVGWVVWREASDLHPELIFKVDYLGGSMPRPRDQLFTTGEPSRGAILDPLGPVGYRAIHQVCRNVAMHLAAAIDALGLFALVSDAKDLPVFAWKLKEPRHWSLYDLADWLRDCGWHAPAYRMPANRQDLVVQRAVVRNGFSFDLAEMLVKDIRRHLDRFASQPGFRSTAEGGQFHQ
jgi:glutamate decarboxylase